MLEFIFFLLFQPVPHIPLLHLPYLISLPSHRIPLDFLFLFILSFWMNDLQIALLL